MTRPAARSECESIATAVASGRRTLLSRGAPVVSFAPNLPDVRAEAPAVADIQTRGHRPRAHLRRRRLAWRHRPGRLEVVDERRGPGPQPLLAQGGGEEAIGPLLRERPRLGEDDRDVRMPRMTFRDRVGDRRRPHVGEPEDPRVPVLHDHRPMPQAAELSDRIPELPVEQAREEILE